MFRLLIFVLLALFIAWLWRRVSRELLRPPPRAAGTVASGAEGLASICYRLSEIVAEAADGLADARFDTLFVRFEDGVAGLMAMVERNEATLAEPDEFRRQLRREVDGVRDRLYGYHRLFSEQQAALERGDGAAARELTGRLQGQLEELRGTAGVWRRRFEESSRRLVRK